MKKSVIFEIFIITIVSEERSRMGLFESANPEVKTLKGLHLYHFALSNCSQRVRIALEEKGLEWISRHVGLLLPGITR
jgi:hypothetical protein